jgi:hypothetical protein
LEAGKRQKHEKFKMLVLGDLRSPEGLGAGSPTGSFEFQFVSFKDIVAATNNFNDSLKIGHGGFGKVYKVINHTSPPVLVFFLSKYFSCLGSVSRIHEFQSHAFSALIYKGNIRWS